MASRFVSGGTIGPGGEVSRDEAGGHAATKRRQSPPLAAAGPKKNPEWEAVQQELDAERKRRDEARLKAATGGEQSLYDILQANKAAKQAAFEEKHKLKNQFRALDDDEAHFLDEVRERMRRDEEQVRRETEEGLQAFRQRQRGASEDDREPLPPPLSGKGEDDEAAEAEAWGVGRKRKRSARERDIKGLRRKVGGGDEGKAERTGSGAASACKTAPADDTAGGLARDEEKKKEKALPVLVDYGSDESD